MSFAGGGGLPDVDGENPIALTVTGRLSRAVVPDLCAELERALAGPRGAALAPGAAVDCDVGGVLRPDLTAVEAVARLGLVARRAGHPLRLRRAEPEFRALLDLVGLADVVSLVEEAPEGGRARGDGPEGGAADGRRERVPEGC
ncbi:STAS domain-containing protein [Streptomyces sp. NPDC049916]|uniref:STAS domain-containing protein n=1 Tax=Streptomyces sp. NPDC049916 TaxID=3155156 RepID=UPI00343CE0BD